MFQIDKVAKNSEVSQCPGNECDSDSSTSEPDQLQQLSGDFEFRIHHLGSNNYRDSRCYLYTKNNCRNSNLYLRCKNSIKHRCPARVTVRGNNFNDPEMTTKHNHPPDKRILDMQVFDKKLEENILLDPFAAPRQLYLKTKKDLLNTIDTTNIPTLKRKEGFIYRRQRKFVPLLPSTVDEFEKYIQDEKYQQFFTKDHRNLPYYRGIWTSNQGERNLVFISETLLKFVNTMNHIAFFMDGTFKALPHHLSFRQLYVISFIYRNQCYPFAYIFMEKKTFTSYDAIFQNLKFLMPSVEVVKVMSDYEAATRKALKKHYPTARIAGCWFHYVQAIVKSTKRFGLRSDEKFKEAIKKICALALLPNEFVLKGFDSIDDEFKNSKSKRWNAFREYWLKQWGPANISVYGLVDRTNNFSESKNKSLNLLLKRPHPNIWNLIMNLKLLEMDKSDQITRADKGEMKEMLPTQRNKDMVLSNKKIDEATKLFTQRNNDLVRLNKKVFEATKLFDEDENVIDFLKHVTYEENFELFVKDQVNIMDEGSDYEDGDETDEEIIPNDYNFESDFRKNHPREAAVSRKNKNQ